MPPTQTTGTSSFAGMSAAKLERHRQKLAPKIAALTAKLHDLTRENVEISLALNNLPAEEGATGGRRRGSNGAHTGGRRQTAPGGAGTP